MLFSFICRKLWQNNRSFFCQCPAESENRLCVKRNKIRNTTCNKCSSALFNHPTQIAQKQEVRQQTVEAERLRGGQQQQRLIFQSLMLDCVYYRFLRDEKNFSSNKVIMQTLFRLKSRLGHNALWMLSILFQSYTNIII